MSDFRVIIAGGRDFADRTLLASTLDRLLARTLTDGLPVTVVSGGCRGADTLGSEYAVERGYRVVQFPANWSRYGRAAGYRRNRAMADYVAEGIAAGGDGGVVCFWDGSSRGTGHMVDIARLVGLPLRIIRV